MPELVLVSLDDGLARVTLNRPEKRNALSPELIDALEAALGRLEAERGIRSMLVAGAGQSFCAGMDLSGVVDDPSAMGQMLHRFSGALRRIRRLPFPTISRVQGAAVGGGCGLMVVTDFAVTHPESRVGYPEVSLGVCPAVVAPWLMRKVGPGRARALLLEGGTMSGERGFELGLATHLAPEAGLEDTVEELARKLAEGGPRALAVTKSWLNTLDGSLDDAVLDRSAELSAEVIAGDEAQTRLRQLLSR